MKSKFNQRNPRYAHRRDRHSVSLATCHLVFCPKFRKPVLTPPIARRCEELIQWKAKKLDIVIKEIAVNSDHVHIFFVYPPKLSLSRIAQLLKAYSSRHLRREFPELARFYKKGLWAPSNYYGSVGQGFEVVESYVKHQDRHHGN